MILNLIKNYKDKVRKSRISKIVKDSRGQLYVHDFCGKLYLWHGNCPVAKLEDFKEGLGDDIIKLLKECRDAWVAYQVYKLD